MKPAKVFVSSTYVDLKDHRRWVIDRLRKAGYHVDPMEDWTSDADEPTRFSRDRLRDCELCVLLVGFRRGFVPEGEQRSITQLEYDEAIERGIAVLPFFLGEKVRGWPSKLDDRGMDPAVNQWRAALERKHGIERFTKDPRSLDILPALSRWRARQEERDREHEYRAFLRELHGFVRLVGLPASQGDKDIHIDSLFVEPKLSREVLDPESTQQRGAKGLAEVITAKARLVILGDPGSGKSTLVDWLICQLCDDRSNEWRLRLDGALPIPLILRDLRLSSKLTWEGLLDSFVMRPSGRYLSREHLQRLIGDGKALIILDGLDEVADLQVRRALHEAVQDGLKSSPCPWILTSRRVGYDDVPFHTNGRKAPFVDLVYVAPFDDEQIKQFIRNWHNARESDAERARVLSEALWIALNRDPGTLQLARVPNLLTMMALVHRSRATLPAGKALLYDEVTQAYLKTIDELRRISQYTDPLEDMRRWLGEIAYRMQRLRTGMMSGRDILIDGVTLRSWLREIMAIPPALQVEDDRVGSFLDVIKRRSGLLIERGHEQFGFTHLSFQEYLTAVHLAEVVRSPEWVRAEDLPEGTAPADLQGYAGNSSWQETLVFLFELMAPRTPLGKNMLRDAVFGPRWSKVTSEPGSVTLLARLITDTHVGWDPGTRDTALDHCLGIIALLHAKDEDTVREHLMGLLFSGELQAVRQRLVRLGSIGRRPACRGYV